MRRSSLPAWWNRAVCLGFRCRTCCCDRGDGPRDGHVRGRGVAALKEGLPAREGVYHIPGRCAGYSTRSGKRRRRIRPRPAQSQCGDLLSAHGSRRMTMTPQLVKQWVTNTFRRCWWMGAQPGRIRVSAGGLMIAAAMGLLRGGWSACRTGTGTASRRSSPGQPDREWWDGARRPCDCLVAGAEGR